MSAELMMMERTLLDRDRRSLENDLEQVRQSVGLLITEARLVMRKTLVLAGYDRINYRRLIRRPGRPCKDGMTLRERHESLLKSVEILEACELAAAIIDGLAKIRHESDGRYRQRLCHELMEEAWEIAGDDLLPAEQILAITIILSRELAEISVQVGTVLGTKRRRSPIPATAEAMLVRLRRQLERVA